MNIISPFFTARAIACAFSTIALFTQAASADEAGKVEAGKVEAGKVEAGKVEAGKAEAGKVEVGRVEVGRVEAGRVRAAVRLQPGVQQPGVMPTDEGGILRMFGQSLPLDAGKLGAPYSALVGSENNLEIVNDNLVVKPPVGGKPENPPQADPVDGQVLEFTDDTRLHGRLTGIGGGEITWQRKDVREPMTFPIGEIRRIILDDGSVKPEMKANATLQMSGGAALTGDLTGFENGKLQFRLGANSAVELDRGKVQWLLVGPSTPPDTYDGPHSAMGLAGWEGANGWEYRDGALFKRPQGTRFAKRFELLPEKLDLEFTISDPKQQNAGVSFALATGGQANSQTAGGVSVQISRNNLFVRTFDGTAFGPPFTEPKKVDIKNPKMVRHRILLDRRSGKFILMMNGAKVDERTLSVSKEVSPAGTIVLQPFGNSTVALSEWSVSKIRILPWDGTTEPDGKPEDAGKDILSSGGQGRVVGALEGVSQDTVRFGGKEFARREPLLIRLAGNDAPNSDQPAVARVQLSKRGGFDVAGIEMHDGQITMKTSFAGDLALPVALVGSIEFTHRLAAAQRAATDGGTRIIFKNGDEMRGTIVSAGPDGVVKWKTANGARQVEFGPQELAAVQLATGTKTETPPMAGAIRLRNGDWLPGVLGQLDRERLTFKSSFAGEVKIDRAHLKNLYFAPLRETPVWDGGDSNVWLKGLAAKPNAAAGTVRRAGITIRFGGGGWSSGISNAGGSPDERNMWRNLDGAFSSASGQPWNIARSLNAVSDKVEVAFDFSSSNRQLGYTLTLFSGEERNNGIMISGTGVSISIYDRSQGFAGGRQVILFGEPVVPEGRPRHFRFLVDRKTRQIAALVDGKVVAQYRPRTGKFVPLTDNDILIVSNGAGGVLSNLWISPWVGPMPRLSKSKAPDDEPEPADEKVEPKPVEPAAPATVGEPGPAEAPAPARSDIVSFLNGDEAEGTVESADSEELHLKSDVGVLELPFSRIVMVEFAGAATPGPDGIRLRLAGRGAFTVRSFKLVDGNITCQSAALGELSFPLTALSEVIFQPRR
jgi:hypothetical protein